MKKLFAFIMILVLVFAFSGCGNKKTNITQTDDGNDAPYVAQNDSKNETSNTVISKNQSTVSSQKTESSKVESPKESTSKISDNKSDDKKTNTTQTDDLQNNKIIITPDIRNVKLSFRNSNDNVTNIKKPYSVDKNSKYEDYIDKSITEKTISFLGKEFKNVPYLKSSKNPYKIRNDDIFANEDIEVYITKSGKIRFFSAKTPLNIFPNENKNSLELAKKYLNAIMPDFKYDQVEEVKRNYSENTWYYFWKNINGIPTSECVTIRLTPKGEFSFFNSYDVGMYDNIAIKGVDKEVYLKKVDEFIKSTYGDTIKGYRIGEDGPTYEIYNDNKLELSIPIEIDVVNSLGNNITYGEYIVVELN